MTRKVQHILLQKAKNNKKDEFYTQLIDIANELKYYENHFCNKVVFCNCDDPRDSNFFKFFAYNFEKLKLKKLITLSYSKNDDYGYYYEYNGNAEKEPKLEDLTRISGRGDFRSDESKEFLKQSDIVVTNPPFSLFREYVDQLVEFKKKFLIIGNINAITYKNIFQLIKENKVWLGINLGRGISGFIVPKEYELYGTETKIDKYGNKIISPNNCLWLTNLDNKIRNEYMILTKKYEGSEYLYPIYDNYEGININKTKDIPMDYYGAMGVPITFLHKFNPNQFEIISFRKGNDGKDLSVNGRCPYFRILIKRVPEMQS